MKVKPLLFTLTIILLLTALNVFIADASYRRWYRIEETGRCYILDFNLLIEEIGDYGVVAIYMRPDGGYAYGVAVIKYPSEPRPHLFLIMGLQHQWYDLGLMNTRFLRGRIVIDTNTSTGYVVMINYTRTFNLSYVPKPNTLYIALFNVTGRSQSSPNIYIDKLNVYVTNKSLDEIRESISNLVTEPSMTPTLTLPRGPVKLEATTQSTSIRPVDIESVVFTLLATSLILIVASIALIVFITHRFRETTGSPGP